MSKALAINDPKVSVGSNIQTGYVTWPNYWPTTQQITYLNYPTAPAEQYANEVEVEQGEHDATLRFYRRKGKGKLNRSLVHEVTVPLGVLEWLQGKDGE